MRLIGSFIWTLGLLPASAWAGGSVSTDPTVDLAGSPMQMQAPGESDFADLVHPGRQQAPVGGTFRLVDPGDAYIVNGVEVPEGEYPEVVYLSISGSTGGGACTGSLISAEYVLTAAHCVDKVTLDSSGALVREQLFPSNDVVVTFGNRAGAGDQVVSSHIVIHNQWRIPGGPQYEGDIALIKLATPQPNRPRMALNEEILGSDNIGDPIQFVGFGITEWQGGGGGVKRKNLERIVALPEARPWLLNSFDAEDRQSTCQGDSGGPGVLLQCGGYIQASVTSHGPQCGAGPAGHMRVDHYLPWIRQYEPDVLTRAANTPSFQCSHRLDPDDPGSIALGVAPFQLNCGVQYSTCPQEDPDDNEGELLKVEWSWGDGSPNTVHDGQGNDLFRASHVYERDGRFSVRMAATYIQGGMETTKELTRFGYVRACGEPTVGFSVEKDEGLTYAFLNETNISGAYGCVFGIQWDIFEGDAVSGSPIASLKSWEPQYTFPSPGTYTAVLNVGGFNGTSASRATFQVTSARGSSGARACSSVGGVGTLGLGVLALGLVGLRRRRS